MLSLVWPLLFIGALLYLAYRRASLGQATAVVGALLLGYTLWGEGGLIWTSVLWLLFAPVALLNLPPLRLTFVTRRFLVVYRRMLPSMSSTEREALEAGTVWWDGELFTGGPNWDKLMTAKRPELTPEEQAFLDGPCEELCRMVHDFEVTHELGDLPPAAWAYLKSKGFF